MRGHRCCRTLSLAGRRSSSRATRPCSFRRRSMSVDAYANLLIEAAHMKQRAKLDAITLAVLRSGLINAVAEMKAVVVRTAYSNLWKEAGDLSCGLLTNRGELAVQGIGDIPIHLASMPMSLRAPASFASRRRR